MNIITQHLSVNDILLDVNLPTTKRLFEETCRHLEINHAVPAPLAITQLWRREKISTTAMGQGIAMPRAQLPDLNRLVSVYVRLTRPIPFDAWDERPVSQFLFLFAPQQQSDTAMQFLTMAAILFSDPDFCDELRHCKDAIHIHRMLQCGVPA